MADTGNPTVTINLFAETAQASQMLTQIGESIQSLGVSASQVTTKLDRTSQELERVGATVKKMGAEAQQATAKLGTIGQEVRSLAIASTAASANAAKTAKTTADIAKTAEDAAAKVRKLRDAKQSTTNVAGKLEAGTKRLAVAIGGLAAAYLGLNAAVGQVQKLVNVNLQYEESMAQVRAVTEQAPGFTEQAFGAMQNEARRMGAATRYSAAEAAEGLKYLAQAGFTAQQATKSLGATLILAQAGGLDLGQASDIVAKIMTAFGADASETTHFVDVLATMAARSSTDVIQLGEGMKYAAPIARGLGISLEETAAALGALSSVGQMGEMAGTGLRQVLMQLVDTNSIAVKGLQEMGVAYSDINPLTNDLGTLFDNLARAGVNAANAYSLFGARGGGAATALLSQKDVLKELVSLSHRADGAGARMAYTMDNTLAGAVARVTSAWEELSLQIGDGGVKGAMREITEDFAVFIEGISNSGDMKQLGENLGQGLQTAAATISTLVSLIAPVVAALGQLRHAILAIGVMWVAHRVAASSALAPVRAQVAALGVALNNAGMALPTMGLKFKAMSFSITASLRGVITQLNMLGFGVQGIGMKFRALAFSAQAGFRSMAAGFRAAVMSMQAALAASGIGLVLIGISSAFEKAMGSAQQKLSSAQQKLAYTKQYLEFVEEMERMGNATKDEAGQQDIFNRIDNKVKEMRDLQESLQLDPDISEQDMQDFVALINMNIEQLQARKTKLAELTTARIADAKAQGAQADAAKKQIEALEEEAQKSAELTDKAKKLLKERFASMKDDEFSRLPDNIEVDARLKFAGLADTQALESEIAALQARAAGGLIGEGELERLEQVLDVFARIRDIRLTISDKAKEDAEKAALATTEANERLALVNAELAGNEALVDSLKQQAGIRELMAKLQKDGVKDAEAMATAIINGEAAVEKARKAKEDAKSGSDINSSNGFDKAFGGVVASMQEIGGGGGVFNPLTSSSERTARATEQIAANTAVMASGSARTISTTPVAQQTPVIGGRDASNSQMIGLLTNIRDILTTISRNLTSGRGPIKVNAY